MIKEIQLIKADGTVTVLEAPPSIAEMQRLLGGFIEHVRVVDHIKDNGHIIMTSMYVNEEGLINGLPRNDKATELYQRLTRAQYPDAPNPFRAAQEAFKRSFGDALIVIDAPAEAGGDSYNDDPWIAGDAIFFAGYTCEEADRVCASA